MREDTGRACRRSPKADRGIQNGSVMTAPASTHITTPRPSFLLFLLHLSDTNVKSTCNAYDCIMLGRFRSVD